VPQIVQPERRNRILRRAPDVIEGLFDYFYVHPELIARKRDVLNAKLKEAGKPPMK